MAKQPRVVLLLTLLLAAQLLGACIVGDGAADDSAAAARDTPEPTADPTATPAVATSTVEESPGSPTAPASRASATAEPTSTASDAAGQRLTPTAIGMTDAAVTTPTDDTDIATSPALTLEVDEASLTGECVPEEVIQLVVDFVDAMNRGNMERLDEIFPDEEAPAGAPTVGRGLMGFSSTTSDGDADFVTSKPDELMSYFAERHEHGERGTLHYLRMVGMDGFEDMAAFEFYITRQADDLPEQPIDGYDGKGWIDCRAMEIMFWAMGKSARTSPP